MVRFVIIGVVIAVAFTLYALVDAAMSDAARARGVSKPVWILLVVLLPVIGGILWFTVGKGQVPAAQPTPPDDDPRFTGNRMSSQDLDAHVRDLEERLRELDDEVFPGEDQQRENNATNAGGDANGSDDAAGGAAGDSDPRADGGSRPDADPTQPR